MAATQQREHCEYGDGSTGADKPGWCWQYFPKGTDLTRWTHEELHAVVTTLNARPRKSLGWRTPAEVYQNQLASLEQDGVASTP